MRPRHHTALFVLLAGCGMSESPRSTNPADLVITNARVLDVRAGAVLEDRAVVVADGQITDVLEMADGAPAARDTLDARGRLLTPGLIDAHSHLAYVLGDSVSEAGGMITRLDRASDSLVAYRRRYADQYLPYGVTTVRDVGSVGQDVKLMLEWRRNPRPWAPTVYPSGGALITHEGGRTPFPGHRPVADPVDAARTVREYHEAGIRHLKLYWRLEEPELEAALGEARRLGMMPTGHIDYGVVPLETALELGLDGFEHAYTVAVGAMTQEELVATWRERLPAVIGDRAGGRFYLGVMEYFHHLGREDPEILRLIGRLAEAGASVTPTLHLFANRLGLTWYDAPALGTFDDTSGLSADQLEHFREGYRIMADYVRRMHEAGVRITVGTDWIEPGRAVLSEMLLLEQAGLSMADVFRAATLDGARALGVADSVGTVEAGGRADLVLFDQDPLRDPRRLLGPKTVIRGGVVGHAGAGDGARPSADPADPAAAAIDSFVRSAMDELDLVPGLALAVVRDGELVHEAGYGWRDRENRLPVTPRTVFYTASLAKAFTGATASVLAADGDIDLDAPLIRFFPELTTAAPVHADEVTLRDLLRHGKGFTNGGVNFVTSFVGPYQPADLVRVLNEYSDPSEGFIYSNTNYALAGYAIETATGRDWRDAMRERVFEPLGMRRSTARLADVDSTDFALPYLAREAGIDRIPFAKSDRTITGAGGIFSTAGDLARFVIAQLDDGRLYGRQVLSRAAVREMQAPQIELDATFFEFERYAYGLGLYRARWEGEELVHHFGGFPGFRSHVSFMPEHCIGVVVLQNEGVDGNRFADIVATYSYDRFLGRPDADARGSARLSELERAVAERRAQRREAEAELARREASPGTPALPLQAYAGEYVNQRLGTMRIETAGDRLRLVWGDLDAPVLPTDSERFLVPWVRGFQPLTFTFETTEHGEVERLDWGSRAFVRRN